ncbi:MAG: ATP-grasp domain-containing protein [Planctomycetes bacterium]|nr:ATP-grasp domain-containing protein [Planctomycetota bacterium]
MSETLVILGGSVRAAAFSAQRSGFDPYCADCFADVDLAGRFQTTRVADYPDGLAAPAAEAPFGGWMYTGGLENCPELVDKIASKRTLYGNPGSILKRVRDPKRLVDALARGGLPYPAVNPTAVNLPRDGSWLRKHRRSTGGRLVQIWDPRTAAPRDDPDWYFQQRIAGRPVSAVYVSAGGQATLLGVTEQLAGTDWCNGKFFWYCGSLGPIQLDSPIRSIFEQIGNQLGYEFGLMGLFGVDAILADNVIWPVEVNPRYPASVEILERAMGIKAIEIHVDACRRGKLPELVTTNSRRWSGKAVLYAKKDCVINDAFAQRVVAENHGTTWPAVADIPEVGKEIAATEPITTVLAECESREQLEQMLRDRIARLETMLFG